MKILYAIGISFYLFQIEMEIMKYKQVVIMWTHDRIIYTYIDSDGYATYIQFILVYW